MKEAALFDTLAILRNRLRALARNSGDADFLLKVVAGEISDRLEGIDRRFDIAIALHCHTGLIAQFAARSGKAGYVRRIEQNAAFLNEGNGIVCELGMLPLGNETVNLVVSALSLHLVDDLPGLLRQIHSSLAPDGLFLAALPGGGTLAELRDCLLSAEAELTGGATPRVIPFADLRDCGALLQRAGFALPVADVETYTVRYDNPFSLMRDLRHMGMSNPLTERSRNPTGKAVFRRAAELYGERYSDPDGRIRASFNIIYLSGWKPDPSQQKPLRPGSAKMRLADALRTREIKP
jgi:SAM-dependent methyltransferase